MSYFSTARLRHQIFRLNQRQQPDLDFGLDGILTSDDLATILAEEGATWKTLIYTPLLTTWAFLWQMLSPDRSCRAAVKRIAAWLSSQGKKLANQEDDPYIKARRRLPEAVPLRLMRHIGQRCHERAEDAWRWCERTIKVVDGSTVSIRKLVSVHFNSEKNELTPIISTPIISGEAQRARPRRRLGRGRALAGRCRSTGRKEIGVSLF